VPSQEQIMNDDATRKSFKDAYSSTVGKHGDIPVADLSDKTDIGMATLRGYLDAHGNLPDWTKMARLFRVLPTECINKILAPTGLTVKRREFDTAPTGPELATSLAERTLMLLRHYEDGFEDHTEAAESHHEFHILLRDISAYMAEREPHKASNVIPIEVPK